MIRKSFVALLTILFAGCGEALPRPSPSFETFGSISAAEKAASQAETAAQSARDEVEKMREMVNEAHELTERAEAAEKRCSTIAQKIPSKPVSTTRKVSRAPARPTPPSKTDEHAHAEKKPEPEYSKSDAPITAPTPAH